MEVSTVKTRACEINTHGQSFDANDLHGQGSGSDSRSETATRLTGDGACASQDCTSLPGRSSKNDACHSRSNRGLGADGRTRASRPRTDAYGPNEYLTLSQAAKLIPGRPSTITIQRWIKNGVYPRTASKRVYLRSKCVGARVFTTQAWLDQFEAECTAAHEAAPVMVNGTEVVSHKQAMRELGVMGV